MFYLTKQERLVLIVLSIVILLGSLLHYSFKKYPFLSNIVNFISSDNSFRKVDLNKASFEQLITIPYIGEKTANKILDHRKKLGSFESMKDVQKIPGIRKQHWDKFSKHLIVRPQ